MANPYTFRLGALRISGTSPAGIYNVFTVPAGQRYIMKCVHFLIPIGAVCQLDLGFDGTFWDIWHADNTAGTAVQTITLNELTTVLEAGDTLNDQVVVPGTGGGFVQVVASGFVFSV